MNIEILSAKYDNTERSSYTVRVKDLDSGAVFPFGVKVGQEDDGDAYAAIMELMSEIDIDIEECSPPTDEALAAQARAKRSALLSASDYYVMPDYPAEDLDAVRAYRQALRDIPGQPGFPNEIDWPEKPSVLA